MKTSTRSPRTNVERTDVSIAVVALFALRRPPPLLEISPSDPHTRARADMAALFDHVTRGANASTARASTAAHARSNAVAEDERGVVYVLNVEGEIRSTLSRDVVRFANDASFDARALAVVKHAPRYDRAFEAESLAVSPSGRHACVSGRFDEGSGARPTAACYVAYLSAGASDGTVPARAGSSGNSGEESDGVEACECETVSVCEEEFDAVASVRVVRCAWHPSADATLAMLTTDGVFRLINCDKVAAGGRPVVERCWKLDLSGSFPEAAPLRPDVVDFSFAPADGWGTFTVYFLAKTGDIHAMCPVAPRGAKYPRVTLKHLDVADEAAANWLNATFPELADTRVPMLAAHVQKDEDRPVALQGPLPRSMKTSARDGSASEDALSIAVSPPFFDLGGGGTMATLHANAVHVHIIPSEMKPSWCQGPHRNMRGYTFVMSDTSSSASELPKLVTVDTIQLSATPGEQSLAKVVFGSVMWDPALRERIFVCVNGTVHSIVLTWLPAIETAAEEAVDENHDEYDALPMPQVVALCEFDASFMGLCALGDPLAEGVVVAIRSDGTYRMLNPPPTSALAESAGALSSASVAAQTLEAGSRSELRALAEGIPKDKMKSEEQIMKECGITPDMKAGDPASNEALAKCASMLKEIYVDYARDVHDEVRTTALRLTAEIRRQKEEVAALLDSANDAIERHNELVERLESAATRHEGIRNRLRDLAEKEKSIPHPLTKAEKLFKSQMEAFQADLPLLKQRIEELTERAAIATERDDDDIGYVGSRRVAGASTPREACSEDERKVSKALAEQGEMIKKNVAKAKLIEELLQKE